jgi:branched-chain amino acid transport system substrate-binding protein
VERLATVDKADFIMPVYATGFNLAVAPTYAKYGYPLITQACVTDQIDKLTKQYPNIFIVQGSTTAFAGGAISVLKKLKDGGQIGNKVAVVNVADDFGIELANAGRPLFKDAGFEIVYDKSYPLGTQDLSPVVKAAKAANPDAFVAWSYPPDTFALLEQAKIEGLNVKAYYSAVATAFPGFYGKYGPVAENVLGAGGIKSTPEIAAYYKAHKEVTGVDADYWGSPFYYSLLQIITQAIEGVGSMDLAAITAYLKANKFKTIVGELDIRNQRLDKFWTVGQWQDGSFKAVNGVGFTDFAPVKLKTWA